MITSQRDLDPLCARLAQAPVVGVDTEYLTDRRFFPELCLIQVATDDEAVLIDPMVELDLRPLGEALRGETPVVVMHAAPADVPLLVRAVGGDIGPVFDTMVAAGFLGGGELSLGAVVRKHLGVDLKKGATLTDWSRRPLPQAAVRYAEDDVAHLSELWRALESKLAAKGRQTWVADEGARQLARALEPPDAAHAWRRIDGVRRLKGVSLAVGAEVAKWRMETAMRLDRPVRRVMGDLGVLAVAEAKPTMLDELAKIRGVDRGVVRDHGEAILAAVARGRELDPSQWPKRGTPPPPELATVHDSLALAARMVAHEVGVATQLAYERDDLAGLTADPPRGRLVEGWRAEVLAPPLLDLLHGRRGLTVHRGRLRLVSLPTG